MDRMRWLFRSWRCALDGDRYVCGPHEDITDVMIVHNRLLHSERTPEGQYLSWYVYEKQEVA